MPKNETCSRQQKGSLTVRVNNKTSKSSCAVITSRTHYLTHKHNIYDTAVTLLLCLCDWYFVGGPHIQRWLICAIYSNTTVCLQFDFIRNFGHRVGNIFRVTNITSINTDAYLIAAFEKANASHWYWCWLPEVKAMLSACLMEHFFKNLILVLWTSVLWDLDGINTIKRMLY